MVAGGTRSCYSHHRHQQRRSAPAGIGDLPLERYADCQARGNPVLFFGLIGSANIQNGSLVLAGGTASLMTDLPVGQDALTAQYSGDSNYAGLNFSRDDGERAARFCLRRGRASSITIASPGGSGAITLTVTGQPGYAGTINFPATSCSGLPRESTCSFSPASVTGSGSTTLTISTKAAHSARLEGPVWWFTSFGASFAGIFLLGGASRRRMRPGRRARTVLALMAFAFLHHDCGLWRGQ